MAKKKAFTLKIRRYEIMGKVKFSFALSLLILLSTIVPGYSVAGTDVSNDVNYSKDVIYQIVTDRFSDGNPNNNPTGNLFSSDCSNLRKYCGGDWQGIINKINDGYLTNMGITAIWISQPLENIYAILNDTAGTTSYHGYWPRDFKKTNPFFGSFADFDNLINTAHAKGIKVIIDFAPNHTSPASQDDPTYAENGNLYDNGTYISAYSDDPFGDFHHNGGTNFSTYEDSIYRNLFDLADLNHQQAFIDKYLKDAVKLWLDKGIDGIRVDAVKHMPFGWQKSLMDEIYDHRPVFTFGEWFLGTNEVDPLNHHFANESGMSLLDFRYGQTLREVLRDGTDDWNGFMNMINGTASDYSEVIDQVTFIDNHDMDRFRPENGDTRTVDMALAVLLTSRGVPTIYYGTEQYMTGNGDPNNRKLMPSFDTTTRAYQLTQKLTSLRQQNPAVAYGDTRERWINSDVLIYERKFGNNVALVAINRGYSTYNITGLNTAIPAGTYGDHLVGMLNGNTITINSNGSVNAFDLGARSVSVWHYYNNSGNPNIGHVGPMMGQVGHTVTIDGEGFGTSAGSVRFGTTSANIVSWSDTQIKVAVPGVAAGKYGIAVTKANGVKSNTYNNYDVLTRDQVSVRFVVNEAYTEAGTNVYLVGNAHEIGGWDTSKAIGPMFNQVIYSYPTWYYDVSVPAGTTIEFKFIKKDANGNVTWEGGSNHTYTTPASSTGQVIVNWQN
jgi:glycosidase